MSNQQPNTHADESRLDFGRVLPIIALGAVALFGGYAYFKGQSEKREAEAKIAEQQQENLELKQQTANIQSALDELKTAKVYKEQAKAVAAASALSVLEDGQAISSDVAKLEGLLTEFEGKTEELFASETGRRISSSPELTSQLNASLSTDIPSQTTARSLDERLRRLLAAPRQAISDEITQYVPGESLLSSLAEIDAETATAITAINRVLGDIEAISEKSSSLPVNQEQTLEQAIASLNDEQDEQRRKQSAETIARAEKKAANKLAEQEAKNRELIAEAERQAAEMVGKETAAKILADAEAIKAEIDAAKAIRKTAEAKAQLLREYNAELPKTKQYLQAFLADGRKMRNSGSGPASLGFLEGKGALAPTNSGLEELLSLAAYYNDRPRGALPEFFYFNSVNLSGKNDKIAAIEKAQAFLIKYGELMVENGTLAK